MISFTLDQHENKNKNSALTILYINHKDMSTEYKD